MHFSDTIGKKGSNHFEVIFGLYIDRNFICNHWLLFWIFFFSFFLKIWSIIYSLYFENVKIHKYCLYWKVFSTDIYRKIFSTVCCFFSYICWSVNCMSWVSKFNNFFLICTETEAKFIFEGLYIVLYGNFICDFPILFSLFFIWSVNCLRDFFNHFVSQSILWVGSLDHRTYLGDVQ